MHTFKYANVPALHTLHKLPLIYLQKQVEQHVLLSIPPTLVFPHPLRLLHWLMLGLLLLLQHVERLRLLLQQNKRPILRGRLLTDKVRSAWKKSFLLVIEFRWFSLHLHLILINQKSFVTKMKQQISIMTVTCCPEAHQREVPSLLTLIFSKSPSMFYKCNLMLIIIQIDKGSMSTLMRQTPLIQYPNGDRFEGEAMGPSGLIQGTLYYGSGDQYKGTFINQMKHGFGIYNYIATGQVYEGEWNDDLWHGKGVYYLLSGEVKIKGTWERGVMNGNAEVVHSNGDRFLGFYRNGMKEGDGEIFYGNGAYFKGKFSEDKPNGYGVMRYTATTIYEGSFKNGLKHGNGRMTTAEGVYNGNWLNDEKNGQGGMRYANQDEYEGGWKNGLRDGEGEYRYNNGDNYRGSWVRDKKEGKGVLRMQTGDIYNGEWRNGKKHGFGKYTFANQDFYQGQFVEGNRFGKGRYAWTDGSFYEGEWKGDKMNGHGIYKGNDGSVVKGLFVNDNLVESE